MTTLLHCYLPVFRLGVVFSLAPASEASFTLFRQKADAALAQALAQAEAAGHEEEGCSAQFAVAVWLDELVLRAAPAWVAEWRADLLQTRLFATATGGEAFFSRLDALEQHRGSLRLVYLFCLLMGFQGKYAQDKALLQQRIARERACLENLLKVEPSRLAYPPQNANAEENKIKWLNQPALLTALVLAAYLFMMVSGLYLFNGN